LRRAVSVLRGPCRHRRLRQLDPRATAGDRAPAGATALLAQARGVRDGRVTRPRVPARRDGGRAQGHRCGPRRADRRHPGAIAAETVFAWPGLGRLAYDGITSRDFPGIQAVVLTTAAIVAAVNLGVDCLYALIDPRIRYRR